MHYKHKIDEDYRQIYIDDFAKKDKNYIKFEAIYVKVNQYDISSAAIFQTNPHIMSKAIDINNSKQIIEYLKSVKSNQITLNVINFTIKTSGYFEKETTKEEKKQSNMIYQYEENYRDYVPIIKEKEYFRKSTKSNMYLY